MKFNSFLSILLGVNLVGISIGSVIGYYFNERFNDYYWLYLSVPILTIGSLLMLYGTLYKK
tara:strand:+ start:252 stop:434 length:183 start_codon:yes stop_codon:yes gene_type:complete